MMKPIKVLLFFLLVGLFLAPLMFIIPADGLELGSYKLKMLSWEKLMGRDSVHYADISNIIKDVENIDSLPDIMAVEVDSTNTKIEVEKIDTQRADAVSLSQSIYRMNYNDEGLKNLKKFFTRLKNGEQNQKQIRIAHYGDSQIEGDRITSYIRGKMQTQFGGFGPGLLPALQPYKSYFSIVQSNEGNWSRYPIFGKKDARILHNKYGILAAFSRFSEPLNDTLPFEKGELKHATISLSDSKVAYRGVRKFKKVQILYGNARSKVGLKILQDSQLILQDSLEQNVDYKLFTYTFGDYVQNVKLEFDGYDSPDIYAIDLSDTKGIMVDNIAMRGASGTVFTKMDFSHLQRMYKDLNVGLFILQFGGNVMPYIKDTAQVEGYGRWFYSQLARLKKMMPEASFVVIGPSDMSKKEGDQYVSYSYLPVVRDALKKATLKAGFCYWDMYEAMGGHNSMPSWVMAQPALAGADYTHFTPKGAKLIANMFYNALMIEYKKLK